MDIDADSFRQWSDAHYPRPLLCRQRWLSLNGHWQFATDPDNLGLQEQWFAPSHKLTDSIVVPFPPGSSASKWEGDVPTVVWYRRTVSAEELNELGTSPIIAINFEAVDFRADVWVNGQHRGSHQGGYTPFQVTMTAEEANASAEEELTITVRAEDSESTSQPRGKQDWRTPNHGIWYQKSTGIWRDVWMEATPALAISTINWEADVDTGLVTCTVDLNVKPTETSIISVSLSLEGKQLGTCQLQTNQQSVTTSIEVPLMRNRLEWDRILWSPEHPNLIDAKLTVKTRGQTDTVISYLGARSVSLDHRHLHINRMPVYLRGVLDQGFWGESYFAAPTPDALREEVELIQNLGFNMARIHERTADQRYLTWADRKGLLLWGESASAYTFDAQAVVNTVTEWMEIVLRDRPHPSIVTWVPVNESWGVSALSVKSAQRALVDALVAATRALDETRPVIANDGWEQLDTDIVTTHDYATTYDELQVNYRDLPSVAETVNGTGPQGRRTLLREPWHDDKPVMVSEFGGISLRDGDQAAWGYRVASTSEEYEAALSTVFSALLSSPLLAGICYTQLTDTAQETNGLCWADRTPKLPLSVLRGIITDTSHQQTQIRPRTIAEVSAGKVE